MLLQPQMRVSRIRGSRSSRFISQFEGLCFTSSPPNYGGKLYTPEDCGKEISRTIEEYHQYYNANLVDKKNNNDMHENG